MLVTVYNSNLKKKTVLNEIVDYRYKRWFYNIGDFEMTVLETDPGEPYKVVPSDILYVYDEESGDDSLYVTAVSVEKGYIKISGQDLKIILNWRITLFPTKELEAGTYGYDVRQGYTSNIIKGYIDYNLCEANDPYRRIDNCYCASEGDIGLLDDSYMSRLQPLNEVVEALCRNAGIGYKVTFDTFSESIIINILEGKDKRNHGGFGTYIGNADSVKRIRDNSSEYTVAWAVNGTGVNDATVTAVNLDDTISSGILRKETVATVNCETDMVKQYTKHAVGTHKETEEIDASINAKEMLYDVGDIVIVCDDLNGYYEMKIIAVEKEYSRNKMRRKLHFVDYQVPQPRAKTLNKLATSTSTNKKDAIDQKLDGGGSGGAGGESVTIENAVVIQESDAKYLLHEYTEVKYLDGNRIGYAGVSNQIIAQEHITKKSDTVPIGYFAEIPDLTYYTDIVFKKPVFLYYNSNAYDISRIYLRFKQATTTTNQYDVVFVTTDGEEKTAITISGHFKYSESFAALALVWNKIYAPGYTTTGNQSCEYGCASCTILCVSSTSNSSDANRYQVEKLNSIMFMNPYIQFLTEAEYNAAVGFTYEPATRTEIQETVTEV